MIDPKEIQTLVKLSDEHPNIIRYYGHVNIHLNFETNSYLQDENDDFYFIAMELCDSHLQRVILEDNSKLYQGIYPTSYCMGLIYQICDAVAFIHKNNMVHCDLKIDNLLIKDGK